MAKNNNKPLNPMAPPYIKLPHTQFSINTLPRSRPPPYLILHPYNVRFHPPKSFPPPPSSWSTCKTKKLTPIPSGPRIPKPRRVNRVVRCEKCTQKVRFAEKKATVKVIGTQAVGPDGRKRWKNTRGGYHQILPLESETTSVMIKNIPNKYTRALLIQILDNYCKSENKKIIDESGSEFISAYDCLYLPIDFKNRVNAGFAFVNFTNSKAASRFRDAFHGKRWDFTHSPKLAHISRAKIQGKNAMINNFKTMDFADASDEDLPVLFEPPRDGSGQVNSRMFRLGKFR